MADQPRSKILTDNPIGKGLDAFRDSFNLVCADRGISRSPGALDQLDQEDIRNLVIQLLSALRNLPAVRVLPSKTGYGTVSSHLLRLISAATSDDFDLDRVKPLLKAALADHLDDALVWDQVYCAVAECTPPPRPITIASSLQQTPWLHNTSSFANSSEYRRDVDRVLHRELGASYVGLRRFHETFFGRVAGLKMASEAVFSKCLEGSNPLFSEGWSGWPEDANQDHVLSWFADVCEKLAAYAEDYRSTPSTPKCRPRPVAQPNRPIQGSTAERKIDVGFVDDPEAGRESRYHWSRILIPGELKSNPSADIPSKAWLDLGTYAREVLAAQDTRRFVFGFTICKSLMRVWEFDRLGAVASEQFDINQHGLQFVTTILGFLWMNEEELGFDPTITTEGGRRFVTIERKGKVERLVVDKLMRRAPCVAGRATTCWKAYREDDPRTPLVIKDSWQYIERDEESELLREATDKHVVNVARYYHHENVFVRGEVDDIGSNVRGGIDITKATNYRPEPSVPSPPTSAASAREGRSESTAGEKRPSSQTDAPLPPSKRPRSVSPTRAASNALPNRVHRRLILRDYGKPVYEASSPSALLAALAGCIQGHESLHKAGFLHRDISINNLMINEDANNPSWPSFLIDLDLAIKEQREVSSGAKGKTGTRAFMAIGTLMGEQHSFMHDLESFFWVLFWICVHYNGPTKSRVLPQFDKWNYVDMEELATHKLGTVAKETMFIKKITDSFTPYYAPLIPLLNRLRKVVFPRDKPWDREDEKLYSRMREILLMEQRNLK